MKLAIHWKAGEINNVQKLDSVKDYTDDLRVFNEKSAHIGISATIEEFCDDSLTAFLYNRAENRKYEFKRELESIGQDIDSLNDTLRYLRDTLGEMED